MYALWVMMAFLLVLLIRTIKGPSVWDRILGLTLMSTKLTIIIVLFAAVEDTAYILDYAIMYVLFGFISTYFIATFILNRTEGEKQPPTAKED